MSVQYDGSTEFLQTLANSAMLQMQATTGNITQLHRPGQVADVSSQALSFVVRDPRLQRPPNFLDMFTGETAASPEIIRLNQDVEGWVNKYFPAMNNCFKDLPEEWLCGVIRGTNPYGLSSLIFDLIWARSRDRANTEGISRARELTVNMAARGFALPNGALMALQIDNTNRSATLVADANRDATIKDSEIKQQVLSLAVQTAASMKVGLLSAMLDAMKAYIQMPNITLERDRIRAQALSAFYSAISQYHSIELSYEELRFKAEQARIGVQQQNTANKLTAAQIALAGNTGLDALGDAVKAFGDVAAQAASGASTLVAAIEAI